MRSSWTDGASIETQSSKIIQNRAALYSFLNFVIRRREDSSWESTSNLCKSPSADKIHHNPTSSSCNWFFTWHSNHKGSRVMKSVIGCCTFITESQNAIRHPLCYITPDLICFITHDLIFYITHDMLCYITHDLICYITHDLICYITHDLICYITHDILYNTRSDLLYNRWYVILYKTWSDLLYNTWSHLLYNTRSDLFYNTWYVI